MPAKNCITIQMLQYLGTIPAETKEEIFTCLRHCPPFQTDKSVVEFLKNKHKIINNGDKEMRR